MRRCCSGGSGEGHHQAGRGRRGGGDPDRAQLFAIQTPQVFDGDLLLGALRKAVEDGAAITDDCSAVERIGMKVCLTEGSYENIKITTPADMLVAEAILHSRDT